MSRRRPRPALLPRMLSLVLFAVAFRGASGQKGAIPTPESVFGFPIGKDSNLVDYEQSIDYFKKLAAASNRIHLINVGTTSFGRPWTAAIITSPENWAKLDHYRQINMRIAHPEGLTDSAARGLARQGKVFIDISGGLHASEIAGSQHTPQLAYELLSKANDPAMKEIFDNVIFFLWPTINPDGQDIVVKNCRETMFGRPALNNDPYEKYMGHDNNRDSYMMNGIDSRVRQRVWREWEPDIIYVHHQSSPFPTRIWIPPFADPVGLRAPAIPAREINTIGMQIAQDLDASGQPGATHMLATFDAYYPGLHRLHAGLPEHSVLVDRDAGRELRHHADLDARRSAARLQGHAADGALSQPVARGKVELARRGEHHGHRVDGHAALRREV